MKKLFLKDVNLLRASKMEKEKSSATTTAPPTNSGIASATNFLHSLLKSHSDAQPDGRSAKTSVDEADITSNMAAGLLTAPSREQCESLAQLMQYLHGLVCITSHQVTEVEKFRAQLAEANTKVSSLYTDNKKLSHGFHHDKQLEILREQQELIHQERAQLEKMKERERLAISQERADLQKLREDMEKQKAELKAQKEDINKQKDFLQRQMDLFEEQRKRLVADSKVSVGLRERSESPVSRGVSPSSRSVSQSSLLEITHKRSASDDLTRQSSPENDKARLAAARRDPQLPIHLLSATNEQKMGLINQQIPVKLAKSSPSPAVTTPTTTTSAGTAGTKPYQQIPVRLAKSSPTPAGTTPTTTTSGGTACTKPHQMLPLKLSGSTQTSVNQRQSSSPRSSPAGRSNTLDSRANPQQARAHTNIGRSASTARAPPASTTNILPMKLAEKQRPKSAGSSTSNLSAGTSHLPGGADVQHSSTSHKRAAGQGQATGQAAAQATANQQQTEVEIIYF